jgi:hypothetical protein
MGGEVVGTKEDDAKEEELATYNQRSKNEESEGKL